MSKQDDAAVKAIAESIGARVANLLAPLETEISHMPPEIQAAIWECVAATAGNMRAVAISKAPS